MQIVSVCNRSLMFAILKALEILCLSHRNREFDSSLPPNGEQRPAARRFRQCQLR